MGQNIETVLRDLKTPEVKRVNHPDGFSLYVPGIAAYKEWGQFIRELRSFHFHWNGNTPKGLQANLFQLSADHNWLKIEGLPASVQATVARLADGKANDDDIFQFEAEGLSGVLVPGVSAVLEWGPVVETPEKEYWRQYSFDFNGLIPEACNVHPPVMGCMNNRWEEVHTHPHGKALKGAESLVRYYKARDRGDVRSMERHLSVIKSARIHVFV